MESRYGESMSNGFANIAFMTFRDPTEELS